MGIWLIGIFVFAGEGHGLGMVRRLGLKWLKWVLFVVVI
jgi:hypothetical protein